MYIDGLCRHLGTVDPKPLAEAIAALGDDAWDEYDFRQKAFRVHAATQTIPLLYDEDMRHTNPTTWPRFAEVESALQPVLDLIRNSYLQQGQGDGYFVRIILTRLRPLSGIPPHVDNGPSLVRSHRHHLAVATNPKVQFLIGGKPHHFGAGEVWEINNRQQHEVRNYSEERRVHLIADYVVPGETIHDPDGIVIA